MKRRILCAAVLATIAGMSGCASAPEGEAASVELTKKETSPETAGAVVPDQKVEAEDELDDDPVTKGDETAKDESLKWSQIDLSKGKDLLSQLTESGLDQGWVASLTSDERGGLSERMAEGVVHILHTKQGEVQEVYGLDSENKAYRVTRVGKGYLLVEPKGFTAETTITLDIDPGPSVESLGLVQRLSAESLFEMVARGGGSVPYTEAFEESGLTLSFKALFMDGKMVGPTDIVSAVSRYEGKEVRFDPEKGAQTDSGSDPDQ